MNKLAMRSLPFLILMSGVASAQQRVEEIVVVGVQDTHTVITDDTLVAPADTAQLLRKMPGANINKNGELTGIAQYRGMYGDRIRVSINGAKISGAGPNAMDAPLHYAPVAILESLTINRGIASVSSGQETIGGFVEAQTYAGEYGFSGDFEFSGRTYFGAQSINSGTVASGFFALANRNHILRSFVMQEKADDLEIPDGEITPSEYDRERYDLGYSYRNGDHEFSLDFARNNTKDAGTASLPMDIAAIDSDLFRSRYTWEGNDRNFTAEFSASDNEHLMTNYHLRRPPQDNMMTAGAMRYRRNWAVSEDYGFALKMEQFDDQGSWLYGVDGHMSTHRSTITNPNAAPFYIGNFNDTDRDIFGAFVERSISLGEHMGLESGIRVNRVTMDSDPVSANLNPMNMMMGMPFMMNNMAGMLSNMNNASDLSQTDNNVDWFARLSIHTDSGTTWYVGAARKSRSPSYQERYLWIPLEATGGLADGKTYVGNPELDPEVSHEVELGFDYDGGDLSFYPRIFYKEVSDFIQGTPATNMVVRNFAQMMANMGMGRPDPLMFDNVDANFYGFDMEAQYTLSSSMTLRAVASMVRGERDDINDDLYRIAPDNMVVGLDYRNSNWMTSFEMVAYADQDRVSATNLEQKTDGYTIFNLTGRVNVSADVDVSLGIENLFDEEYEDHLAAYNRAFNPDIAMRGRMPGLGRNVYARLMWNF
ncbi:MAG: TonB-dependent receptor [Gammaproteobacteria bacterium]|mgnify:FL=1|jgi:iron complex outermembrane receptor protein|nr:TonB-dependent receptor [Gammaproteobacteria bacterium]MBT3861013.1 TonB-dependent receptor [Gammaproteobacteria bacterium]MBT3986230.1 TonB-dependent receptor [Gammaproteobacteria bacterium]MBT4256515.1 TonB-dependent receptor [Gammaproteobacteria bacterium]MBT4581552.1 TonB-dependent receptor [Gammaproteobacteria bacterium]